jgi:RNA polymerase sigma factor (sigma-70 family)
LHPYVFVQFYLLKRMSEMKRQLRVITSGSTDTVEGMSDDELIYLAAHDRQDAFAALVSRHQALVFGLATRFLGDRQSGRDVTQDVFLALWAERHKYRRRGMFRSYLMSICINRCRVVARSAKNRHKKAAALKEETRACPDTAAEVPLDALLKSEQKKTVQRCLTRLPEKTRTVLIYRFTHGMSLADIADITGMPLGTVKSHVVRGLGRLGRMMKRET